MHDTETINEYDDWISKSQLKRESKILHTLGEEIVCLSQTEFDRVDFTDHEDFRQELLLARKLKSNTQHEPYRREMLHVERLMRSMEEEFIARLRQDVDTIHGKKVAGNAAFHRLEKIRYDLLGENSKETLDALMAQESGLDRNKIRMLIKKARKEAAEGRPPAGSRELFRYLRENLSEGLGS